MKLRRAEAGEKCHQWDCDSITGLLIDATFKGERMGALCLQHMNVFMEDLGVEHAKTHPEEAADGLAKWRDHYRGLKKVQEGMQRP